jgi:hypothetical protein
MARLAGPLRVVISRQNISQPVGRRREKGIVWMTKAPSQQFNTCRKLVHNDALEARLAAEMATPLNSRELAEIRDHHSVGIFLRRSMTRYLGLVVSRLLEDPGRGRSGTRASIGSLLVMAQDEAILSSSQIQRFHSEFKRIKTQAAKGEYDLVRALRELRNIYLAHTLIPHNEPADDVFAQHLIPFAKALFDFVMTLDQALAQATSISLPADLRKAAEDFQSNVDRFYDAVRTRAQT